MLQYDAESYSYFNSQSFFSSSLNADLLQFEMLEISSGIFSRFVFESLQDSISPSIFCVSESPMYANDGLIR